MTPTEANWEIGGLTDPEGRLDRVTDWKSWWVPEVDLDQDRLVWALGKPGRQGRVNAGMLEEFVKLAAAPANRILAYARRSGVLGICEHGLPASHNPPPRPAPLLLGPLGRLPWCRPLGFWEGRPWEPVEVWRAYAGKFRSVLNIAARLYVGHAGSPSDWQNLNVDIEHDGNDHSKRVLSADRTQLGVVLSQWLGQAQAGLTFEWHASAQLIPAGRGLFGALVILVVLAVGRRAGLATCSACSTFYTPSRRPRPGGRRYCPSCRQRQVPQRDAAADYRARLKEQAALRSRNRSGPRHHRESAKRTSK